MHEEPPVRPTLTLVASCPTPLHRPLAMARPPAAVYWFRRALLAGVLLLLLWASSLLAAKLRWTLNPENPVGHAQMEPAYVIVGDTAMPLSSYGR